MNEPLSDAETHVVPVLDDRDSMSDTKTQLVERLPKRRGRKALVTRDEPHVEKGLHDPVAHMSPDVLPIHVTGEKDVVYSQQEDEDSVPRVVVQNVVVVGADAFQCPEDPVTQNSLTISDIICSQILLWGRRFSGREVAAGVCVTGSADKDVVQVLYHEAKVTIRVISDRKGNQAIRAFGRNDGGHPFAINLYAVPDPVMLLRSRNREGQSVTYHFHDPLDVAVRLQVFRLLLLVTGI